MPRHGGPLAWTEPNPTSGPERPTSRGSLFEGSFQRHGFSEGSWDGPRGRLGAVTDGGKGAAAANAASCRLSPRIKICNKKSSEPHVIWPIGFVPALSQARGRPSGPLPPASTNGDKNVRQFDYAGPWRGVTERRGRARPQNHPDKGSHGTGRHIPPAPLLCSGQRSQQPQTGAWGTAGGVGGRC